MGASFRQLVDPTIAQAPKLLEAAHGDAQFTLPGSLPFDSRDHMLSLPAIAIPKGPFLISWMLYPDWTDAPAHDAVHTGGRADMAVDLGEGLTRPCRLLSSGGRFLLRVHDLRLSDTASPKSPMTSAFSPRAG